MKHILLILMACMPLLMSAQPKKLGKKSSAEDVKAYCEAKVQAGATDEAISILNTYDAKMKTDLDKAVLKTTLSAIYRDLGQYEDEQKVLIEGIDLLNSAIANNSFDVKKYKAEDIEASIPPFQLELCGIAFAYDSLDIAEKYVNEALKYYKAHVTESQAYLYYISACQVNLAKIAAKRGVPAMAAIYNSDAQKSIVAYSKLFPAQGENATRIAGIMLALVDVYRQIENYASAIELVNQGIRIGDASCQPGFYDQLGQIYLKMNNIAAAKGAYEKVVDLAPQYYETHFDSDLRFIFYHSNIIKE